MAALAALSGAALASDSVLRGASDVIDKRVIPRVVNSLATRLGDAGDWNSVAGDRVRPLSPADDTAAGKPMPSSQKWVPCLKIASTTSTKLSSD